MGRAGINTVRIYDAPSPWLLDLALRHRLRVIAGLAWEQHVAFLAERGRAAAIASGMRAEVARCAGHPAILAWAIGNEIPSDVVRWHGRRPVERFLQRLARAVRAEDPAALVTYASYPSTEYLDLPFLDFLSFNVFLEQREQLERYLARLHNLAGDRPLVLSEIGLDAARNGEQAQARTLAEQTRAAFAGGCAGAVVFSWTDEWHRGGADIEDWSFGLTARDGRPKPALAAVAEAYRSGPFDPESEWPRVSVVVCSRNGAGTLEECLEGATTLDYPDYETIVVDDGSTDATAEIAASFPAVRLVRTEGCGLSCARNRGLAIADGELVAYLDDDARPDRHWLRYLAMSFRDGDHAGIGGPNIQPPVAGLVAGAVARAPGGPIHVLISDTVAEHIPGCNMAFRRAALEAVGGFDERFRTAGDDVDVCWRLQLRGWTLGFSPAAVVDHRARSTIRAYWRQQHGYGRAEALLERKWPERYNGSGHLTWAGRVYGSAAAGHRHRRWRVYYGPQGTAPFQHAHDRPPRLLAVLPLLPEWYLALALLVVCGVLATAWVPPAPAFAALAAAIGATVARAAVDARRVVFDQPGGVARDGMRRRWLLATLLHVTQPPARLAGRLGDGLSPWRCRAADRRLAAPLPHRRQRWHETWHPPAERRAAFARGLERAGRLVRDGGPYDRWDLELRTGALGRARALLVVEEHGRGRQLVRVRIWPNVPWAPLALAASLGACALAAAHSRAWLPALVLGVADLALLAWVLRDASAAVGAMLAGLDEQPLRAAEPEHAAARATLPVRVPAGAREEIR